MRRLAALVIASSVLVGCDAVNHPPVSETRPIRGATVRILMVGDVMMGRGVAPVVEAEPDEVFAGVRHLLQAADIAAANLESPLTDAPHIADNENVLIADPDAAKLLASAGFDVISIPNNHSTDAGAEGLLDTLAAIESSGMKPLGAGITHGEATAPVVVSGPLTVGFLAFDATGVGTPADNHPGIAVWDEAQSANAVRSLRPQVDVIVVSIHGGTEYLPTNDPGMVEIAEELHSAGADVVWGHGAHVTQPVRLLGPRPMVAATSLGNFLFDQSGRDRTTGAMLEVLAGSNGVIAFRVGIAEHADRRVEFVEWVSPGHNAVLLHGSWWNLVRDVAIAPMQPVELSGFHYGDVDAAGGGDVTGDGATDLVVAFRRPHQTTPLMELRPDVQWADARGRSAHVGVYDPDDLSEIWVAGTVLMPVANLAVCDGAIAVVHDELDEPGVIAAGAWEWNGFGFDTAPDIPGAGTPGCADVDGDGHTEPVILDR